MEVIIKKKRIHWNYTQFLFQFNYFIWNSSLICEYILIILLNILKYDILIILFKDRRLGWNTGKIILFSIWICQNLSITNYIIYKIIKRDFSCEFYFMPLIIKIRMFSIQDYKLI
jgi:hypothetical protein